MDLLTPGIGLIFWQLLIFGLLFLFLSKYAWKPITNSLREREKFISNSLKSAQEAEEKLEDLNKKNEALLKEARKERAEMHVRDFEEQPEVLADKISETRQLV